MQGAVRRGASLHALGSSGACTSGRQAVLLAPTAVAGRTIGTRSRSRSSSAASRMACGAGKGKALIALDFDGKSTLSAMLVCRAFVLACMHAECAHRSDWAIMHGGFHPADILQVWCATRAARAACPQSRCMPGMQAGRDWKLAGAALAWAFKTGQEC